MKSNFETINLLLDNSQFEQCLEYIDLELNKNECTDTKNRLLKAKAYTFIQLNQLNSALKVYLQIELAGEANHATYNNIGDIYFKLNNFKQALTYFLKANHLFDNVNYQLNLAKCYSELGSSSKAIEAYKKVFDSHTDITDEVINDFIFFLLDKYQFSTYKQYIQYVRNPRQKDFFNILFSISVNNPSHAEKLLNNYVAKNYLSDEERFYLYKVLKQLGKKAWALELLGGIEQVENNKYKIAKILEKQINLPDIKSFEKTITENTDLSDKNKADYLFAAASQIKKTNKPYWLHLLTIANNKKYNLEASEKIIHRDIVNNLPNKIFNLSYSHQSACPIFIVGMPRSGTTLLETIISGHSDFAAAGELGFNYYWKMITDELLQGNMKDKNDFIYDALGQPSSTLILKQAANLYLENLNYFAHNNETYIVDKMPHNFLHVGVLSKLFPNAKFIHIERSPLNNCLSIFEQNFSLYHHYKHTLDSLGQYYKQYQSVMTYWHDTIDEKALYRIRYEDLVSNTNSEVKKLCQFLNVEWQEGMENISQKQRVVKTASIDQVRQDIYTGSLDRTQGIEKLLEPLKAALSD